MALRDLTLPLAVLLLAAAAQTNAAEPAANVPPPTNERCLNCHEPPPAADPAAAGQAAQAQEEDTTPHTQLTGAHADLKCVDCHTAAETVRHPRNPLGPVSLEACEKCHASDIKGLSESVHATINDQPLGPATCAGCHEDAHSAKNRANTDSAAHPQNQTDSCGGCHRMAKRQFLKSAHAEALKGGDTNAPTCVGCHSAHSVQSTSAIAWRLDVSNEQCGTCHEARGESFRDNFHGQMAHLGFGGAAYCADCHRGHDVLPASNAESSVAPANLVETCGKCHEQANENFVQYKPHANPHEREDMVLWGTMLFMEILIIGVFAFFGLHSVLWLVRSIIERARHKR
jgi:hypothetical protein